MARKRNASEPSTTVRRSIRLAGREANELGEPSGRRNVQENQVQPPIQQTPIQRRTIDYDRVSVHTWRSDSPTGAGGERQTREDRRETARTIQDREIEALETLRQGIHEERRIEAEERANLTRQNHELRMENERLQNRRSRSTARSNTRSTRREEGRISPTIQNGNIQREEIQNQGERLEEGEERIENRFILIPETVNEEQNNPDREIQRRRRMDNQDGEENPEEGRRVLRRRNTQRTQQTVMDEIERHYAEQARLACERERLRAEVEEREFREALRQNNHDNRERRYLQNRTNENIDEEYDREQRMAREERHECRRREAALKKPMEQDPGMNERILRELAAMRGMMDSQRERGRGQLDEALEEAAKTPFTREVQSQRIPPKCSLPALTSIFDGSTCAIQHVKAYMRCMLQWEHHDAVLCKYFASSLTEEALKWFEGLPNNSISSFDQLRTTFLGAYITNNASRLGIEDVFGLKQRVGESLRNLTKRWKTMCSEMAGRVPERYLILSFINALFATNLLYIKIFRVKNSLSMTALRELQEEYITLEERQNDMESYPVANTNSQVIGASLLPKIINAVTGTTQEKMANNLQQKIVAMGSRDQEELEKERNIYSRGGNNKIQRFDQPQENYGGQRQNYNRGPRRNFEEIKMPPLNTSVEKIWEAIILMENIPTPNNMGVEPASGYGSQKFCLYHHFHGHTTNECSNIKRIILRMIDQGKLDHFLARQAPQPQPQPQLPPPPQNQRKADAVKEQESFFIEVGAKARNAFCNSIVHSFRTIEDFHDNVLTRVFARDGDGREIMNIAKVSPLEEWQKKTISFTAAEVPGDGEMHDHPLVVKLEINPNPKEDEDDDDEDNKAEDTWALNRILIDTGSSVNILFYHAYRTMKGKDEDLIPSTYKIYGFNGTANKPKGEITMHIPLSGMSTEILFCVVDVESPYNALIGRPWLHSILGVASTFHQCVKFPHPKGIGVIRGDWIEGKKCYDTEVESCEERSSKKGAWRNKNKEKQKSERLMAD